jgi:hypothetical protein
MKVNQIYGLNYEWIPKHAQSLVFSKDTAWLDSDLVPTEKKMLFHYPITRLLPMYVNEVDLQITLHYKIGAKMSISHMLQQRELSEADCLRIFYAIVATIAESTSHLLNETRYLLLEQFIYIGSDYTDVHLIYLPVLTLTDKPSLQQEISNLGDKLFEKQKSALSPNTRSLLLQLESTPFLLHSIKEMLFQCIKESSLEPASLISSDLDNQETMPQLLHKLSGHEISREFEPWLPQTNKLSIQKWMQSHSHNPILVIAAVFSVLLIWYLFTGYRSIGTFNLSMGLSLLIINLSFKLHRSIGKLETGDLSGRNPFEKVDLHQNQSINPKDYYVHLSEQTTLLAAANGSVDATVLLPRRNKAVLELQLDEQTEIINLIRYPFIIGRNSESSQFVANWVGISRKHIEINRNGTEHEIKDLGSKNGTFLNEEQLVPFKTYLLKDGDNIKIVEKQFIYKKI